MIPSTTDSIKNVNRAWYEIKSVLEETYFNSSELLNYYHNELTWTIYNQV